MSDEKPDFPFDECAEQAMPEPNKFWKLGICEECGHTTNIEARGCNYAVVMGVPQRTLQQWMHELYPNDVPPPKKDN